MDVCFKAVWSFLLGGSSEEVRLCSSGNWGSQDESGEMGKRTRYLTVSQDEAQVICGAWAAHPSIDKDVADHLLLGRTGLDSEPHTVALARYDFDSDQLTGPKAIFALDDGALPRRIAVHPGGEGVIIAYEKGCKLFEWEGLSDTKVGSSTRTELKLQTSGKVLIGLEDVGPQNCLLFGGGGSLLASGGEDGHVRVFQWPSMEIVFDLPRACNSIKDLDISFDSAFLSATAENSSPCSVWDLSTSAIVATLTPTAGESFGFCRFSRDRLRPFLFISITKEKKGFVGVWDLSMWKRLGAKKFQDEPITAFAVSHHGKRLAIGTLGGDISIVEIRKMELQQLVRSAHLRSVTSLEFSLNDKAVLSVSSDFNSRVTALDLSKEWKEWQLYLVLAGMFLASIVVFYLLHQYGDTFWQFPRGRNRPATPLIEAVLSDDEPRSYKRHQEL